MLGKGPYQARNPELVTPTTYADGSSIVPHGTDAALKTLSTASVRLCALPFVPGPSPMKSPAGGGGVERVRWLWFTLMGAASPSSQLAAFSRT